MIEYNVRKKGASVYVVPTTANTRGSDKTIIINVTGSVSSAPYFTDDWKTTLRVFFSSSALSFEKAGNSTVAIGTVKKDIITVKLMAAW
jgi:hypothetical protein